MKRLHEGEYCIECGRMANHTHHCLSNSRRAAAEKYGLTVRMCAECHSRLHDRDEKLAMKYRKLAQIAFEYKYSHEEFMKVFGRNYL